MTILACLYLDLDSQFGSRPTDPTESGFEIPVPIRNTKNPRLRKDPDPFFSDRSSVVEPEP